MENAAIPPLTALARIYFACGVYGCPRCKKSGKTPTGQVCEACLGSGEAKDWLHHVVHGGLP